MGKNEIGLYKFDSTVIKNTDFASALKNLGISKGDTLFVHSDIAVFGKMQKIGSNALMTSLIDVFKEAVGEYGTIVMPAFSYSYIKGEPFDVQNSRSKVGSLTEFFRKMQDVRRTVHPTHSAAVWGYKRDEMLNIGRDTFGAGSVFDKLHSNKGKIIFLGAPFQACTYVHYIEQNHSVPYRYLTKINGKIIDDHNEKNAEFIFYRKYLGFFTQLDRLEKHLVDGKFIKEAVVGNGKIQAIDSDILLKEGLRKLKDDNFFFLKDDRFLFKAFNRLTYPLLKLDFGALSFINERLIRIMES